jgi:hypothetical protein
MFAASLRSAFGEYAKTCKHPLHFGGEFFDLSAEPFDCTANAVRRCAGKEPVCVLQVGKM